MVVERREISPDSGGYQFSACGIAKITDEGVRFRFAPRRLGASANA